MKKAFHGKAKSITRKLQKEGIAYGVSLGRRAPMHRMHADCLLEIVEAGLKPVIVIGSVNGVDSDLYDPVHNPLTVEQQKEQIRRALPAQADAVILTLEDMRDDAKWMSNFVAKLKYAGIYDKAVIHFRSKSADAEKINKQTNKPLSQYTASFTANGLSVWQSFNTNPDDDNINASDIRHFDLEKLTAEQRALMSAPDYIIDLAKAARESNPDRWVLEAYNVPITVLDLAFDRMWREAGIRTAAAITAAREAGGVNTASLTKAASDIVRESRTKKPLLLMGPGVAAETADILIKSGLFDVIDASIGKFQSDEPFAEPFHGDRKNFAANAAKIRGAQVYVVQSTAEPVGDNVLHLQIMIHTLKLYGAAEVTAVVPFAAFSRQDRSFDQRFTSVAADLFVKQLKTAGADKIVSFTMHSQAASQFYRNVFGDGFTALSAADIFARALREKFADASGLVVGAPDGAEKPQDEGQKRARELSLSLSGVFNEKAMFRISKVHTAASETKITSFDGDVAGKDCVVIDDMVDGGSTTLNAARLLKEKGAKSVTCCFTHAVLTGKALERLMAGENGAPSPIDHLVMTDAIPGAVGKAAAFAKTHPAEARKIDILPLGHAILDETKKQLKAGR